MRWLFSIAAVLMTPVIASAAPAASDPAFLGITMDSPRGGGYCSVRSVTPLSPAAEAGIQFGDLIVAMDGQPLTGPQPCSMLTSQIVAHRLGDKVKLDVRRGASRVTIAATLSSRSEVLYRRFVNEPMIRTELDDADNESITYDLGARGKTTIAGWFMLERCANCARVFDRVNDGLRKRMKDADTKPVTLAISAQNEERGLTGLRKSFTANVSLAVADEDLFETLALNDSERITFMVIDCRGVVRFVAPIAPDADDIDAVVDDVLAAVEQAEHQRTTRRN